MTHSARSKLTLVNDRTTQGFYLAIFLACLSFAGIVLGPADYTDQLLSLAWLFMLSAIGCLVGKLGLELALEAQEQAAIRGRMPEGFSERAR